MERGLKRMKRYHFLVYLNGEPEGIDVAVDARTEREARERVKVFYGQVDDLLLMKVEKV